MSSTVNVGEAERMYALDSQGPNREDPFTTPRMESRFRKGRMRTAKR